LKKQLLQERESDIIEKLILAEFLIRAAAKNFDTIIIIASVDEYSLLF
jgi:AICAR transformylase/IMP cyclohydrolase PurH